MVWFTVEQQIFIVETYLLKRQNYDRCALKFWRRFPGATVPSKSCIIKLFRKWREYLWFLFVGDLKQKVYVNKLHILQELENEIRRVLSEITEKELQKVFQNFL